VVDRAQPFAKRSDGALVGEVDELGADARLVGVGRGQGFLVAASGDNSRSGVQSGQRNSASEPTAAPDNQHGLVF
jgi:hypothetical protein